MLLAPAAPPPRSRRARPRPPPRRPQRARRAHALPRRPPARWRLPARRCRTPAAPSAATGRRATGRRCRSPRAELAARLRAELEAAVQDALPRPGVSALLLSGGLDSSVVAALAAPRAPGLQAIAAAFAEPELDETVVGAQGRRRHGRRPHHGPHRAARAAGRRRGLPARLGAAAARRPGILIEAPLIAAAARLGAGVVLDGQGGDELFGAAHFLIADRVRRLRPLSAWRLVAPAPVAGRRPAAASRPARVHERRRPRRARAAASTSGPPAPARGALHAGVAAPRPRAALSRQPGPVAVEAPRRAALVGLAGRHADARARDRRPRRLPAPARRHGRRSRRARRCCDLGLVELALRMPPETNFDPVTSRPLVREALRGALPADVLARRDKRDFSALHHRVLASPAEPRAGPAAARRAPRRGRRLRRPAAPAPRSSRPSAGRRRAGMAPVGGPRLERRHRRAVATRHA